MRTVCLLALLLCFAAPVAAQSSEAAATDLIIEQAVAQGTSAAPVSTQEAFDTILDFGLNGTEAQALTGFSLAAQGNLALVRQTGLVDGMQGLDNDARANQTGSGNLAVILQQGDGNVTAVSQNGVGNLAGIRLVGSNNQLGTPGNPGVDQVGDGNVYLLDFEGNGQAIAPTTQVGIDNQVVQIGNAAAPFGVQQYGDGMRMIIRHNGAQQ